MCSSAVLLHNLVRQYHTSRSHVYGATAMLRPHAPLLVESFTRLYRSAIGHCLGLAWRASGTGQLLLFLRAISCCLVIHHTVYGLPAGVTDCPRPNLHITTWPGIGSFDALKKIVELSYKTSSWLANMRDRSSGACTVMPDLYRSTVDLKPPVTCSNQSYQRFQHESIEIAQLAVTYRRLR